MDIRLSKNKIRFMKNIGLRKVTVRIPEGLYVIGKSMAAEQNTSQSVILSQLASIGLKLGITCEEWPDLEAIIEKEVELIE